MGQIYQTTVNNTAIDRRLLPSGTKVIVSTADSKKIAASALADELIDLGPGLVFSTVSLLTGASADGVTVATLTPGFHGRVVSTFAVVTTAVTTPGDSANIKLRIAGVDVVGGRLSLTSASATPAAKVLGGTQVVAKNEFTAAQSLTFVVDGAPVAFAEGAVMYGVLLAPVRKDGAAVV